VDKKECRSWHEIAPQRQMNGAQLDEFLAQSDECIFTQGACHVMAAALYQEFKRKGASVHVYEALCGGAFKHYLVGRTGLGYTDVQLRWEPPESFDFREVNLGQFTHLARALGNGPCCIESDFLAATEKRATSFIAKHALRIDQMAAEAKVG